MAKEFSERGFAQYGTVEYHYDPRDKEEVRVYESSSAEVDAVWLDVSGTAHLTGPVEAVAGIPFGVAKGSVSAHLVLEEAIAVRDLLDEWIAEHSE